MQFQRNPRKQSTRESLGDISTASAKFFRSKLRRWNGNEGKKPADIVQWNRIDFGWRMIHFIDVRGFFRFSWFYHGARNQIPQQTINEQRATATRRFRRANNGTASRWRINGTTHRWPVGCVLADAACVLDNYFARNELLISLFIASLTFSFGAAIYFPSKPSDTVGFDTRLLMWLCR